MAIVRTNVLSLGTSHPTLPMPISMLSPQLSMPMRATGDASVPQPHVLPMNSLAGWLPTNQLPGRPGCLPPHPAPLLAQALKLDTGLVALEAGGQELLLELEKNQ